VIVEPWYATDDGEPLERALLGFAMHPGITRRAAMRVGEHFMTRVAFLESPSPPQVRIGDALWDEHVTTFAASAEVAAAAFHPRLRKLLAGWGFQGHLELRARGGLVVHWAGLRPIPAGDRQSKRLLDCQESSAPPVSKVQLLQPRLTEPPVCDPARAMTF
jgi:hypothetical protein